MDDECPDDECSINSNEYGWVKAGYPTVVAFSRAMIWNADKINNCLKSGILKKSSAGDIPAATVAKIVAIAVTSKELSDDFKMLL